MKANPITLILTLLFCLSGSLFAEDEKKSSEINNPQKLKPITYPKLQKLTNLNKLIYKSKGRLSEVQLQIMNNDKNWIRNEEYNDIDLIKDCVTSVSNITISIVVLRYEAMIKASDIKSLEFIKFHKEDKSIIFKSTEGQIGLAIPRLKKLQLGLANSIAVLEVDKIINNLEEIRKFVTIEN